MSAQRGASIVKGERRTGDDCSLAQLYRIPAELCDEIAKAASRMLVLENAAQKRQAISARHEEKEEN